MSEQKNVHFLKHSAKQELFVGLLHNPPMTIAEFLTEASLIEKRLEMRTRQFNCQLMPDCTEAHALCSNDLRETVKSILREELQNMFPPSQPGGASINYRHRL